MTLPNITSVDRELTISEDVAPGYVVLCMSEWAGRDKGSAWEVASITVTYDMSPDGGWHPVTEDGRRTADVQPTSYVVRGYKLTKKGGRLTGHTHQLWWLHDMSQVEGAHAAAVVARRAAVA